MPVLGHCGLPDCISNTLYKDGIDLTGRRTSTKHLDVQSAYLPCLYKVTVSSKFICVTFDRTSLLVSPSYRPFTKARRMEESK